MATSEISRLFTCKMLGMIVIWSNFAATEKILVEGAKRRSSRLHSNRSLRGDGRDCTFSLMLGISLSIAPNEKTEPSGTLKSMILSAYEISIPSCSPIVATK